MSIQYYGLITELPEEDALLEVTADGQDKLVQVKFADSYSLTLYVDEGGSVEVHDILGREATADHSAALFMIMPSEQPVTVVATAESGYRFIGWQVGTVTPSQNKTFTFMMTGNAVLKALFERSQEAYGLQYHGTPTETGTYELQGVDAGGTSLKIEVRVLDPEPPIVDDSCYLTRYDKDGSSVTMYLPNVQSIEETDTASITEISTIIYGFNDNFAMDIGTTQSFTVTFDRVQPKSVEDPVRPDNVTDDMFWGSVDYTQQDKWSNTFWFWAMKRLIEGWQNLNFGIVDDQFKQTGGFRFHFEPQDDRLTGVSYKELYPTIDENVVVVGQLQYNYNQSILQHMRLSIPLTTSTMIPNTDIQEKYVVTYHLNDGAGADVTAIQTYPIGVKSIAPNVPPSWMSKAKGATFDYWIGNGVEYGVGDRVPEGIRDLYGHWTPAKYAVYTTTRESKSYTIGDICPGATKLTCILIGAGGNGGQGHRVKQGGWRHYGGGGGSGAYVVKTIKVTDETEFTITRGISGTTSRSNSKIVVGETTYEAANGSKGNNATSAHGGTGGAGGVPKGVKGGDAEEGVGGIGADLSSSEDSVGFVGYSVEYNGPSGSASIGPFSSKNGLTGYENLIGVGGDGVQNGGTSGSNIKPGNDGIVIVILS